MNKQGEPQQDLQIVSISRGFSSIYSKIGAGFLSALRFIVTNAIYLIILLVIGVSVGLYLDKNFKKYTSNVIVAPNFKSADFLYSQIEMLNSRLVQNDSAYLKSIGIKNYRYLSSIKVEPVVDIYNFVTSNEQNYRVLELLADSGNLNQVVIDNITSKNYKFHSIQITSSQRLDYQQSIAPIIDFLNSNSLFTAIQKVEWTNVNEKIKANNIIIQQIDDFLGKTANATGPNGSSIYISENNQLNDIILTKNQLLNEQGTLKLLLLMSDKTIKVNSATLNIASKLDFYERKVLILPIAFILIFIMIRWSQKVYMRLKHSATL